MKKQLTQNQIDHYESLKKQDMEHRTLIRKLQVENEELKQALKQAHVSGQLPPDERGAHPTRDWG